MYTGNTAKITANFEDAGAYNKLLTFLTGVFCKQEGFLFRPIVPLCIGSDRYTGDALGPLVGSYLAENTDCDVYGNLEYPVHAGNLVETINVIENRYHHPIVIAIDACLGHTEEIGNIEIWQGGLNAGIALGKMLPCVGHISVVGVVNSDGNLGYSNLQNTRLSLVMKLSSMIGEVVKSMVQARVNKVGKGTFFNREGSTYPTSYREKQVKQ